MGFVCRLSLRNLLRQKRRNILLGSGIAFGMMILIIADAFSCGMADVLMNDFVAGVFGHLVVVGTQGNRSIIHDRRRVEKLIRDVVPPKELVAMDENPMLTGRGVGNGEVDDVVIMGEPARSKEEKTAYFNNSFTLVKGNFNRYFSQDIEYPVIISAEKAKSLNVGVNDEIRLRVPMVTGQIQAARLTVVAIVNANNAFKTMTLVMDNDRLKNLLGYKSWESPGIKIMLKHPESTAEFYAARLRHKLHPQKLVISGKVNQVECKICAFKNDPRSTGKILNRNLHIVAGDSRKAFGEGGVMLPKALSQKFHLKPGDEFSFDYATKYCGIHRENFTIDAVYEPVPRMDDHLIWVEAEKIYPIYNKFTPLMQSLDSPCAASFLDPALAATWKLYERSKDSQALQKKYNEDRKIKTGQAKLDVVTMYQGASAVMKMEKTMKLITFIAFLVLFFIIQIGVVNTLRLTVKERTREIGTVRAIGMQKNDVRMMFMMENLLLTAISCGVGILLGIIMTRFLGLIRWNADTVLSLILKDKHLFFKVNPTGVLTHFGFIMLISGVAAYFPARRAAKLTAVEALQHYE